MTTQQHDTAPHDPCAHFDAQLGAYMERDLDVADQTWMAQHRAECAACDTMARELEQLVADAAALPDIAPPRDLWTGIEARLETPVIALPGASRAAPGAVAVPRQRTVSVKWLAVAATLLVAVSSGVTWQIARSRTDLRGGAADSSNGVSAVATGPASVAATDSLAAPTIAAPTAELVVSSPAALSSAGARTTRLAGTGDDAVDANSTYEREISALRHIVDERFTELDPATVTELRRNLDIIDRAIGDSRAALARDPRSGVVSAQLDRALQAKLDLLRRVALL